MRSKQELERGGKAPDFLLKGADGRMYSLDSFKNSKALLIVFMCNHCPYVKPKIKVLNSLQKKYGDHLAVVGINPNDAVNYPEDSYEMMVKMAEEKKIDFVYLRDETQEVAKAYGAVCTPDPFLFDEERRLFYHGRLDNAMSPEETATAHDMDEAIGALLSGKKIEETFKPSQGCSIKWKH